MSGDHQSGVPGQRLVEPLIVRVLGQRSQDVFRRNKGPRLPMRRIPVVFELERVSEKKKDTDTEAGADRLPGYPTLLDPQSGRPGPQRHRLEVITDDSGLARVTIQLGTENGDWRIEASVQRGNDKKPLKEHFRVATGVEKLTDNIETAVGKDVELKLRLVERGEDGSLLPLEDRVVFFRMVGQPTGVGEKAGLNNRKAATDKDGVRDGLDLTLGDQPGIYQVLAEVAPKDDDRPIRGILFTVKAIDWTHLVLEIFAGALLFLVGVRVLGGGFLIVLSPHVRLVTGPLATNRLLGYLGGVLSGASFQSASTVTSHLTSFANGGLLTGRGALGLTLGAALGATLLPQALSLDLDFLVAPLLGAGLLFLVVPRTSSTSHWSGVFLGAGLVIGSWGLLGEGLDLLALSDRFRLEILPAQVDIATDYLAGLTSFAEYLGVGILASFLLRTSNLIVIVSILMASRGILMPFTVIPLILGANLGSGLNGFVLSLSKLREARRVGAIALTLNGIAALLFIVLSLIPFRGSTLLLWIIEWVTPGPLFHPLPENLDHHLATAHTLFNLVGGLVVLVTSQPLLRWIDRVLVPRQDSDDLKPFRLDRNLIAVPSLALRQTVEEIVHLMKLCRKSVAESFDSFRYGNLDLSEQVVRRGQVITTTHTETSRYLVLVGENQLSRRDASDLEKLQSAASCLYRIGECAETLRELTNRRVEESLEGTEEIDRDLSEVYDLIMAQFGNVQSMIGRGDGQGEDSAVKTVERLAKFRSRFETQWRQRIEQANMAEEDGATDASGGAVHLQAVVYQEAFDVLFQIASHLAHIAERVRILSPERI